ncbi:MAG: aminotransferase class I/II-fold pyridoxal phosphate-dependent enzyme [Acidimicrobiales bacterium]|nr:aminotransferase class I/II-fold pyridoxal phosphate-dependent enzyme [Acidimicrobiales bacterium]
MAAALGVPVDALLDLAATRNPVAPDVVPVLRRHLDSVRRYPQPRAATASLAAAMGVAEARLVLTNGGAEAIALVAAELPAGRVDEPEFALYRRHLGRSDGGGPRWRSNPNNPTGRLAAADDRAGVWDEAFYPLATGSWTRGDPGAVALGSLTKLWACPGLRLGYVLAPDEAMAARLVARQPWWSVGSLALAATADLLAATDLPRWSARIAGLRTELVAVLHGHGLATEPSSAPFLLARGVPGLRERLAPWGVLVRDCRSFGMPDAARLAVPDEAGLERLDRALAGALG